MSNFLFVLFFLLIIIGGFVKPIIRASSINYYENRPAKTFVKPTLKKVINNEFQDEVESVYADQIPLSTYLKKTYNYMVNYTTFRLNDIYYKRNPNVYNPIGEWKYFNGYLVRLPKKIDIYKKGLDLKIANYKKYFSKHSKLNFYVYYIEKDIDINFENNEKSLIYEYLEKNLEIQNPNIISRLEIKEPSDYQQMFYKTDHHWNHKGAYQGYLDILKMFDKKEPLKPEYEKCIKNSFSGSIGRQLGVSEFLQEEFCAYKFNLSVHTTNINGVNRVYGNQDGFFNDRLKNPEYGNFYGGDDKLIVFDYNNPKEANLLILGDSYDNAIIELIASHFNKTFSVDLRNYKNEEFNFSDFVKKNKVNKVLIIGSVDNFFLDDFLLKG